MSLIHLCPAAEKQHRNLMNIEELHESFMATMYIYSHKAVFPSALIAITPLSG